MFCSWVDKLEVVSETVLVMIEDVAEENIRSLLGSSDDSIDNFDCDDGISLLRFVADMTSCCFGIADSTTF